MRSEFPYKHNFLDYLKTVRNYSVHTQSSYLTDLEQFFYFMMDYHGNDDVLSIDDRTARAWVRELAASQISPKSIHRKFSALRSFLKYLYKHDHISEPISLQVQLPKSSKNIPSYLKEGEMAHLLAQMKSQEGYEAKQNYLILLTFYHTGMRRSE